MNIADLIEKHHVFILTGAGVSTESGIPTFRGFSGLWCNHRIEDVASPEGWRKNPQLIWEFYSMRRKTALSAKPNPAHFAIAGLQRQMGDRLFVVTQNVDDLHEQAGARVVHMHGELFKSRCTKCKHVFEDRGLYEYEIPLCDCGGRLRPHIVWFGEKTLELDKIHQALDQCTLFIAVGTSGIVEPAASFVSRVASRAWTVYVGPDDPANEYYFRRKFEGKAGKVLPALFGYQTSGQVRNGVSM